MLIAAASTPCRLSVREQLRIGAHALNFTLRPVYLRERLSHRFALTLSVNASRLVRRSIADGTPVKLSARLTARDNLGNHTRLRRTYRLR